MTAAEKKISAFCARNGVEYEWQQLRFDGVRAVITSVDRDQHATIINAARRLKGIRVTDWTCSAGGVWDGRIYLQDAADAERMDEAIMAEEARNELWWAVYSKYMSNGADITTAVQAAERAYPTPA